MRYAPKTAHDSALAIAASLLVIGCRRRSAFISSESKTGQIDSIAVLPLENRSSDPEADYISDGITESINNSLARLPSLKVIPHSVAFHYKGKAIDVQKIGEALGVQSVLTGRVATARRRLYDQRGTRRRPQRQTALGRAIQPQGSRSARRTERHRQGGFPAAALATFRSRSAEIDERLDRQSRSLSALSQRPSTTPTNSPKTASTKVIDYFNQAIAIDPNYGLAYDGLAYNYINQDDWYMSPSDAGPKAKEAAKKALAIDDQDADAHLVLAIERQWYEWDWAAAEQEFKRAIELNPNSFRSLRVLFLVPRRRWGGRTRPSPKPSELSKSILFRLSEFLSSASVFVFTRQWDLAIEQLRSANRA